MNLGKRSYLVNFVRFVGKYYNKQSWFKYYLKDKCKIEECFAKVTTYFSQDRYVFLLARL